MLTYLLVILAFYEEHINRNNFITTDKKAKSFGGGRGKTN